MRSRFLGIAAFLAVTLVVLLTAGASALAAGSLTVSASQSGGNVTISGVTAASANVGLEVEDPHGNVVFVAQDTSDSQGNFSAGFTLSAGAVTGTYTVYATAAAPVGPLSGNTSFTVQQVQSVTVTAVNGISTVSVPYGTALANLALPATVGITLSDGTTPAVNVTWDGGTPPYNGSAAGNYTFTGALALPNGVTNPNNLTASVTVTVLQQTQQSVAVTGVTNPPNFSVAYGTPLAGVGLPTTVGITLSDGTTPTVNVTWDGGTPTYNGSAAGNYTFTGTLALPSGVTNPQGLTASAVVTVPNVSPSNNGGGGGGFPSLAITTTSLATATVGHQYTQVIATNDGGTAPYTFTITSGSLPSGLALDSSTGVITGTPATAGTYTFTVTVKDAHGNSASESYSLTVGAATPKVTLTDIAGSWAQGAIDKLLAMGVVRGYPDGTFRPNNDVTRAEFATMLVKALKLTPKAGHVFADTEGMWCQDYVSTAAAYGIVEGYDAAHFGPQTPITREQMTAMVVRAAKLAPVTGQLTFKDAARIDQWAREDVLTAVKDGLIHGYPDGTFRPLNHATRAEAATVIAGLLK